MYAFSLLETGVREWAQAIKKLKNKRRKNEVSIYHSEIGILRDRMQDLFVMVSFNRIEKQFAYEIWAYS